MNLPRSSFAHGAVSLLLAALALGAAACAPVQDTASPIQIAEDSAIVYAGVNSTQLREAFAEALVTNKYVVKESDPIVVTEARTTDTPLTVNGKQGTEPTTLAWEISFGDSPEGAIAHPTPHVTSGGAAVETVSKSDMKKYLSSVDIDVRRLLGIARPQSARD